MRQYGTWSKNGQRYWKSIWWGIELISRLPSDLSERHFWVRFLTKSLKSLRMPRQPSQNSFMGCSDAEWAYCELLLLQSVKIYGNRESKPNFMFYCCSNNEFLCISSPLMRMLFGLYVSLVHNLSKYCFYYALKLLVWAYRSLRRVCNKF